MSCSLCAVLHFQKDHADGVTATAIRKSLHHNPLIRKSGFIKSYLQQWFLLIVSFTLTNPPYKQYHVNWGREEGKTRRQTWQKRSVLQQMEILLRDWVRGREPYLIAGLVQCKSVGQTALKTLSHSKRQQFLSCTPSVPGFKIKHLEASNSMLNCCTPLKIIWKVMFQKSAFEKLNYCFPST